MAGQIFVSAVGDEGSNGGVVDVSNVTSAAGVYFGATNGGTVRMQNVATLSGGSQVVVLMPRSNRVAIPSCGSA